jgi:hypothetical protein
LFAATPTARVLEAFDQRIAFDPEEQDPARKAGAWAAQRLTRAQRDFVAAFREQVVLPVQGVGSSATARRAATKKS